MSNAVKIPVDPAEFSEFIEAASFMQTFDGAKRRQRISFSAAA